MEPGLQNHLCFRLYVASRLLIQAYTEELAPLGLTYPKYLVLLALNERGALTVSQLGQLLSLDSGTLSPLLKSLAAKGLVKRHRLPEDERTVVSSLTPQGKTICKKAYRVAYGLFERTELAEKAFLSLLSQTDDFVNRCQRILVKKSKKESPWKEVPLPLNS